MTHSTPSPSNSNHTRNKEKERFILPPITSMDSFFQSRSWPPPATSISPFHALNSEGGVSPASSSSYMSIQENLLSPPPPTQHDSSSWSPVSNRLSSKEIHPHHQPRLDYFTTTSSSHSSSHHSTTTPSGSSTPYIETGARYTSQNSLNLRDSHHRQSSLPQLSTRRNSISSILSKQPSHQQKQQQQQSIYRYQPINDSSPSSPSQHSYHGQLLSPSSLSTSNPSLRSIENDIEEVVRHCNTLADNMNQRKGSIVENDAYFSNPTLMRPWLDDMIGRANEVLNALLRLRKHQLAAEHARQHRDHLKRENWNGSSNHDMESAGHVINSVRHKKRGKRPTFQNRCHSCNISETPEWRRGPDGARTLCNACGLHYAKLAKKVKQEADAKKEMLEDKDDTSMK